MLELGEGGPVLQEEVDNTPHICPVDQKVGRQGHAADDVSQARLPPGVPSLVSCVWENQQFAAGLRLRIRIRIQFTSWMRIEMRIRIQERKKFIEIVKN